MTEKDKKIAYEQWLKNIFTELNLTVGRRVLGREVHTMATIAQAGPGPAVAMERACVRSRRDERTSKSRRAAARG